MAREQATRREAVRLLKGLLEKINAVTASGGDATALRARYRAAGDAIVDGRFGEAKAILTSTEPLHPPPAPAGTVIKIDFVRRRVVRAGRA